MVSRSIDPRRPLEHGASVAIVGASLSGLRAAQALRAAGFAGSIELIGEEPHLPYDRPPLSKQVLTGAWGPEKTRLLEPDALDRLGIEVLLGHRAVSLDPAARRVELDDGSEHSADAVVIATGASPRRMFEPDAMILRTLDDCLALRDRLDVLGPRARVLVVGAGFIGAEVASCCVARGCEVTVVELLEVPLSPVLGPELGAACGALHRANGVDLRTGTSVAALTGSDGDGWTAELSDGSSVVVDVVVVGVGVVPRVDWLEGSGLEIADGVVCDRSLFAADGVVAVGDLARWPIDAALTRIEHWEVAAGMGAAAAESLLAGRDQAPAFVPVPYFWSDQYGEKIQVLGRPDPADEVVVVDGALDGRFVALYRHGDALGAVLAMTRPRQLIAYRPLLAAGASFDDALAVARG
jgi:NADPH-dependent 2,4-dienoyl-CoA reductase/sulfur reductase-like enzyme